MFLVGANQSESFVAGSIIKLAEDDGSYTPEFKLVTGTCNGCRAPYGYFPLSLVTPYTERPHEALRATYKPGQEWEWDLKSTELQCWHACALYGKPIEPEWHARNEYRLKPEPPKQTRREQLIEAGVPAEELAKVVDIRLEEDALSNASESIFYAIKWKLSPQGYRYWDAWYDKLNGKNVTIPEPLDAAPELYCVVFGDDNRMCSINGSVTITAGTFDVCDNTAKSMRRLFPDNTYRVMRLVPA